MVWRVAVVAFEAGLASSVMTPLMLFPDAASSWLLFLAWPSSVNTVFLFHIGSHFRWSRNIVLLSLLCGGIRKERSLLPDCFYNHLRASKLISIWLFIAGFHAEMRVITIQALLGDWY